MSIYGRLLSLVKPHWWRLALAMICMGFVAASTSAVAYLIKPLLDEVFIARDEVKLTLIPGAVLVVYLSKGLFYYLQSNLMNFVGMTIINDLRVRLFTHIQSLSLSFFYKNSSGSLISRILNDVSLVQSAVTSVVTGAIMDVFTIVGLMFVIFSRDWKLAIIGLFILPMAVYPIYYFGRRLRRLATDGQVIMSDLTNILAETFQGQRIVKAFNMEAFENNRFAEACRQTVAIIMRSVNIRSINSQLMEGLGGVCVAGIIWYGGFSVIRGESTPGSFISFMTALLLLYEPIKRVTRMNESIQQGLSAAERIFEILDIEPDIQDRTGAVVLPPVRGQVEFRKVTFAYGEEPVLKDIDLTVRAGEVLAIVGVSGGGKSSLVNLIPRFHDVNQGAVLVDGHDVRDVTVASLRAQISIVSQNVVLFNETVRHNIAYGNLERSLEDIQDAAGASYAHDFIMATPDGYDTVVGERGARFSGGERQRLAMARALLKNAPILILDEATSSLDTESEAVVQRALENLMRGRTTLVIAHRLSTVRHADRIIVIAGGRIIEEGDHETLMALSGEYRRLYDLQFSNDEATVETTGPAAPGAR